MPVDGAYATRGSEPQSARRRRDDGPFSLVIFVSCILATLYLSWIHRNDGWINPEHGLGYALGIIGGLLMLVLLLYPLRKRMKSLRSFGTVAGWFRLHMILGIIGPVLVILHSNYKVQSLNAAVALYTMLIVSISGIVGRYIYGRIHRGLYGSRLEARELIAEAGALREDLGMDLSAAAWRVKLAAIEQRAGEQPRGFFSALARAYTLSVEADRFESSMWKDVRAHIQDEARDVGFSGQEKTRRLRVARDIIRDYAAAVRKVGALAVNERLFAAWHILHMPLFFMLILTALIHVVAVHLY